MFDNLINNRDPNLGNWLVDPVWNLILIDHTRALAPGKAMVHKMNRIEKGLWERMLALELASLKPALDPYLDGGQIKEILARRDEMQKEIDKLVGARGRQTSSSSESRVARDGGAMSEKQRALEALAAGAVAPGAGADRRHDGDLLRLHPARGLGQAPARHRSSCRGLSLGILLGRARHRRRPGC